MSRQTYYSNKVLPTSIGVLCFCVLSASYVVNAMDRQVFSLLLPSVVSHYNISLSVGGLLFTIFTLGVGLAGVPTGYAMDRFSRKAIMMIAISIYSAFTILTAFATSVGDMLLYRVMTGVGEGMQIAALFAATAAYYRRHRTLVLGILTALFGVGNFIGPLWAGVLLAKNGWQWPLIVFGLLGFVFVVAVAFVSRKFTEATPTNNEFQTFDEIVVPRTSKRNIVFLTISTITFGVYQYGFFSMYPTYMMKVGGYSGKEVGFVMSFFGLGAIAAVVLGYLGDRWRQKWIIIGLLAVCAFIGYSLFNFEIGYRVHLLGTFFLGLAGAAAIANLSSALQKCVGPAQIGRASGVFVSAMYIPASASGYVFGMLVGAVGWGHASLVQLTAIPLLGVIAMLCLKETSGQGQRYGRTRSWPMVDSDNA